MRKVLVIISCLFGGAVMAQTGTIKLDSLAKTSSLSGFYSTGTTTLLKTAKSNWSQYWQLNTSSYKPVMTISDQKPDSTYHVWFDRKAITWTSDSTFILKRK